jgi:hypothetical protein
MRAPVQKPLTGSGEQQKFIDRHTDAIEPIAEGEKEGEGCQGETKYAQLAPDMMDEGGLEDSELPAPEMPADQFVPEMPASPAPDAAGTPIDVSSGRLSEEDEKAVRGAMMHFRNMGMSPLEALDKFTNAYKAMFDKYGDTTNPQRMLAEAAVIKVMSEAFMQPSVIPVKAEMSKTDLGSPNTETHAFGGNKKPTQKVKDQKGVKHPDTKLVDKAKSKIESDADKLSKNAPNTVQSTKSAGSKDLVITFDPDLGDFFVLRGEKKIASHASLNAALADAERRQFGTEARIFIDDGQGELDEV